MAKVSVIIPLYNQEKYIYQCLSSVVNQTLTDIEIIIVNDGSSDASIQTISDIIERDKRIKLINKSNTGYGNSMNLALKSATGDYIGIVESDDYISTKMYEKLYDLSDGGSIDIVKGNFWDCFEFSGKKRSFKCINRGHDLPAKMVGKKFNISQFPGILSGHPSIWSCIYKRSFILKNKIVFKEDRGASWVDNPFFLETLFLADTIVYTAKPYYYYRRDNPLSSTKKLNYQMLIDRMNDILELVNRFNVRNELQLYFIYRRIFNYANLIISSEGYNGNFNEEIGKIFTKLNPFIVDKYLPRSKRRYIVFVNIANGKSKCNINLDDIALKSGVRTKLMLFFPPASFRRKLFLFLFPPNSFRKRMLKKVFLNGGIYE